MDKLDEMEAEFLKHEIPVDIESKLFDQYVFLMNIDDVVDELEKEESRNCRTLFRNNIQQDFTALFGRVFNTENADLLEMEELYLIYEFDFIEDIIGFCGRITEYVDEKNYIELARLFDFMIMHYANSMAAMKSKREGLKYARNGIEYVDNRYTDTSKTLRIFMNNKLREYQQKKKLEKKQ